MGNIPAHWKMIPSKRVFVEGKERRRDEDVSATASQKYGIISQEDFPVGRIAFFFLPAVL